MVSLEPGEGGLKWDIPSPKARCFIGTPIAARSISIANVSIEWLQHQTKSITLVHKHMDSRSNIIYIYIYIYIYYIIYIYIYIYIYIIYI